MIDFFCTDNCLGIGSHGNYGVKIYGVGMKNSWIEWMVGQLRALGPYLAVELILPGGSLLALLLWLYRHRHALQRHEVA